MAPWLGDPPASSAPTGGGSTVQVPGSNITFNNTFTVNVTAAFQKCIVAAEQAIAELWTTATPFTLNLKFDAQATANGFEAYNNWDSWTIVSYASLKSALESHASGSFAQSAVAALPTTDPNPAGGNDWYLPEAYGRMLGLSTATPAIDDTIKLATSFNWTYGQDVTNLMEHEISEGGLGRVGGLGDQNSRWSTLDLFRYNANGQPDYSDGRDGEKTYFSYDGGATLSTQSFNNQYNGATHANTADTGDFVGSTDVFGGATAGETNTFSQTDIEVIDALGWIPVVTPAVSSVASSPPSGSLLGTGSTVTFTVTMSTAVTVNTAGGNPTLALNDNETAVFVGGSGTDTLTFSYTVKSGDTVADLKVTGVTVPQGSGIASTSGVAADLSGVTEDSGIKIDTTPPALLIVASLGATGLTTVAITAAQLRFDDTVSGHSQETYTIVSGPADGELLKNGKPAASFTQADIDNHSIGYFETAPGASSDAFTFTVADAAGNKTAAENFRISIAPEAAQQSPAALNDFGWAQGWGSPDNPRLLADVNQDGTADYVGFGYSAVLIGYGGTFSGGPGFAGAVAAANDFGTSEGYTAEVQRGAADAGIGAGDVIYGQGFAGIYWYEATGSTPATDGAGNAYPVLQYQSSPNFYGNFGSQEGWSPANGFQILKTAGTDSTASILGFGDDGIIVGPDAFAPGATAAGSYLIPFAAGNNSGWDQQNDVRTFTDRGGKAIDLNGDGIADFVGMGPQGLQFAFGSDNGPNGSYQLGPLQTAQIGPIDLGDDQGWNNATTPRTIVADLASGFYDIIAFGAAGVYVAMGQDPAKNNGQPFGQLTLAMPDFGSDQGWSVAQTPRLIGDVNGDGIPDIVGFGDSSTFVALGSKDANGNLNFAIDPKLTIGDFGASQGWSGADPQTVRALAREPGPLAGGSPADLVLSGADNTQTWQFV